MKKLSYKVSYLQACNIEAAGKAIIQWWNEISWVSNKGFYKSGNRTTRNPQKYLSPCPNSFDPLVAPAFYLTRSWYWHFFWWTDVVDVFLMIETFRDLGGIFISMILSQDIWILWNKPSFFWRGWMVKPDFVIGLWLVFLLSEQFIVLALSKELYLLRRCPCSKR